MSGRLVVDELVVEFIHEKYAIRPLDGLSFEALPGEMTVLLGPSGSGKTTLLSCLGGILTPTSGSIRLGELDITGLASGALEAYRRNHVGFVFQAFNLIPSLTALQNVAMPLILTGSKRSDAYDRAAAALNRVGMGERKTHLPSRLSGGQQQRVAVARGIVHEPPLLLADEPTANLDHIQAESIIALLRDLREQGSIIVVSTHDARLVPVADTTVQMAQGADTSEPKPQRVRYVGGESVFEQGDKAHLVYMIEEGTVDIVRVNADGSEERLATLDRGQYFGELGALLGYPRSASARAATDVTLTAYGPQTFRSTILLD
jgi:putative ABC transport system ATP-binding protein